MSLRIFPAADPEDRRGDLGLRAEVERVTAALGEIERERALRIVRQLHHANQVLRGELALVLAVFGAAGRSTDFYRPGVRR